MPTSLGPAEILVILVVALIVLGPKRLPEAGRQVGKALAEVRRWTTDVTQEMKGALDVNAAPGTNTSVSVPAVSAEPAVAEVADPVTVAVDQPAVDTVPGPVPVTDAGAIEVGPVEPSPSASATPATPAAPASPAAPAPSGPVGQASERPESPPGDPARL